MQKLWQEPDPDRKSLCSFVLFGLRGMAAYSYHARVLGYTDGEIDLFFCTALRAIAQERDKDKLFQLVEDTGRMAYRVMAELDKANTGAFGDPEPVEVPLTIEKGPFIVISGHDLYDAKCLLEQTEGKGINVYTHSEMLPAHGYPELKKRFPHLKGNLGTARQKQRVALARTMVMKPRILLLDEPLSALDGVIKESIKDRIKTIAKEYHLTTIIVTHDPEEALTLSDRVMIINEGEIAQFGKPEEIINTPGDNFVRKFILNQLEIKKNNIYTLFASHFQQQVQVS